MSVSSLCSYERKEPGTADSRTNSGLGGSYLAGYTGFICSPEIQDDVVRAFAEHAKQINWAKLHLENIFASPQRLGAFLGQFPPSEFLTSKVKRPDDGDNIDHDIYVYVNLPRQLGRVPWRKNGLAHTL